MRGGATINEIVGRGVSFNELPALPLDALTSLTIEDAVRRTGFSRSRLYELIKEKRLLTFRFGKRRFIDGQSLRRVLAELMAPADPNCDADPDAPSATPQGSQNARSGRDESLQQGSRSARSGRDESRRPRRVLEDADA
jgi:hypothetical protein